MTKRKSLATALKNQQAYGKRVKQAEQGVAGVKKTISKSTQVHHRQVLLPFRKTDRILFLGEGNFSFSASCIENHLEHAEDVVATCFDDSETLLMKYPEASRNIESIIDCCGTVRYSIDATKLQTHFKGQKFDSVVFMFPHVAAGIADESRNILTNQRMLSSFFKCVQEILATGGRVAVSLACSRSYDLWDLRGLAKSQGLKIDTSAIFHGSDYPGYEHRRTRGNTTTHENEFSGGKGEERTARLHIFSCPSTSTTDKLDGANSKRTDEEDEDDS